MKILVDISYGHKSFGFSGIPQESRFIFSEFVKSSKFLASGLIIPKSGWKLSKLGHIENQAIFLGLHAGGRLSTKSLCEKMLEKAIGQLGKNLCDRFSHIVAAYSTYGLSDNLGAEIIWREYFASTVASQERALLMKSNYRLTDLGLSDIEYYTLKTRRSPALNTIGYEFALFQNPKPISVSKKTVKVVRYHDGIPLFSSDTMTSSSPILEHYRSVRICRSQNSLFVCNSPSSLDELEKIAPGTGENASVIPCMIPDATKIDGNASQLKTIAITRRSDACGIKDDNNNAIKKWFGRFNDIPEYLLTVGALEPKKNLVNLVAAWQKVRIQENSRIKLMVVGSLGWEYEKILAIMRPFVRSGDLIHLEKVDQSELGILYSSAKCFIFPSLAEGFGLPPIEAMQHGCPVIVSDIPAHRYSAGSGAIFCDPYDIDDMAQKIAKVVIRMSVTEKLDLIEKGYKNASRFTFGNVMPIWEDFFETHRPKNLA
ncbi:glycosyltransferase family 1 protein [Candidatus Igneacidithiobacillus taiwanensis]|uniref:glycosyltransferase family 4 protein n=1 Tax=Candidatus Igneacidithiobacillus taiwanensis TaxID=1945924 RepID=UPI00289DFA30|nr:glycosyltransferase family 1 protein [Candidatus Igneacidithiobacillus taiwanensis]